MEAIPMGYRRKSVLWMFARSSAIMAILLLPFLYIGRLTVDGRLTYASIESLIGTVFAPAATLFNILCASLEYCIGQYYSGELLVTYYYFFSVVLYGYVLALIWSWVSFPKDTPKDREDY